jgi:hypothetical protein
MIATNRPAIAGTKYMSATDTGVGVWHFLLEFENFTRNFI